MVLRIELKGIQANTVNWMKNIIRDIIKKIIISKVKVKPVGQNDF